MPRQIQTAVQVANLALRTLQMPEIESFNEESTTAQTVREAYDLVLRRCLGGYPWSFSQKQTELERLPMAELPQWKFSYKLPPDFVELVWLRGGVGDMPGWCELLHFEIVAGNVVCANAMPPLFCRYQYEAPVALMPHYFLDYLVQALAEELAPIFGYNVDGQKILKERAMGKEGKLAAAILAEERHRSVRREGRWASRLAMGRNW
ncbi:MAG: hypothetical protein LBP65_01890 [Puniceicoccales bacterium]|jgi:hypothetical protein|nr:hypothetical protein [Puniceicoccales bacterium]